MLICKPDLFVTVNFPYTVATELAHDQTATAGAPFGFLQTLEDATSAVIATLMKKDRAYTNPTQLNKPIARQKKMSAPPFLSVEALQQKNPLQTLNIKHTTYPYEHVQSVSQDQTMISMSKSLLDISSHDQFQSQIYPTT